MERVKVGTRSTSAGTRFIIPELLFSMRNVGGLRVKLYGIAKTAQSPITNGLSLKAMETGNLLALPVKMMVVHAGFMTNAVSIRKTGD